MRHLRTPGAQSARHLIAAIRDDERGISMLEFAICLPVVTALAMYGLEIAYMSTVNMQVSQLALSVADNASRLGQTDNSSVAPTIAEANIDAVMFGAMRQGQSLNLEENGRVILSSLEKDDDSGKQYIHWQRCAGELDRDSSYGNDSDRNGLSGAVLNGMGLPGKVATARDGQAVMFAEVFYTYQPLFGTLFANPITFRQEAAFVVRDDRNLSGGGGDGLTGTASSTC